jgi:hypothetical protein
MKLIHVKQARSVWVFDLRDLNPKGKDVFGDLIDWIKEAYGFAVAPDPENPVATAPPNSASAAPGYVFQRGHFQVREEIFIEITTLTLFNDGIVIDTPSSTEEADRFAGDLLQSASQEYALVFDPTLIRRKMYVSELVVRSDIDLERLNPKLTGFSARVAELIPDGPKPQFSAAGLSFWSEPNDSGAHKIFSLERQAGKFFSEHRYYSQAPLHTSDHLRLLEDLERLVME